MSQPQETTGNVPGNDPLLDLRKPNAKRALEKIRRTSSFGSSEADGVNSTDLGELTEAKQVDVMHDAVGSDTPGSDAEGYGDWSDVQMWLPRGKGAPRTSNVPLHPNAPLTQHTGQQRGANSKRQRLMFDG